MLAFVPDRRAWRPGIRQAALCLGLLAAFGLSQTALGQHHGGGMGGHGGFGSPGDFGESPDVHQPSRDTDGTMRGGLQLGPSVRWWDDKHFAKQLHLRPDQKSRMDAIFEQNRTILLKRSETLDQEEQRMEALTHARTLDENALFAQIDRVEQARADLEKATTHYLFQIRGEMDPDQLASLEEHQ